MTAADADLDATGLRCPMPALRARRALKQLAAGQVLRLVADDPATQKDIPAFCRTTGHDLAETSESDGKFIFFIRKR